VMNMLVRMRTGDFSWGLALWGIAASEYSIVVYREYPTQQNSWRAVSCRQ
jgi:hypothetical protein